MNRNTHLPQISWPLKAVTWLVLIIQPLIPIQGELFALTVNNSAVSAPSFPAPVLTPTNIVVNRTVPVVSPPSSTLQFSAQPTDAEISTAHVFNGSIISMGGTSELPNENTDLAQALLAYHNRSDLDDASAIENFLQAYPHSPRYISLLADLAMHYRSTCQFTKALAAWQQVWTLGKNITDMDGRQVVDESVSQWASFLGTLGRKADLDVLMQQLAGRDLHGPAASRIFDVKNVMWQITNNPAKIFKCGPFSLSRIQAALDPTKPIHPEILAETNGVTGTSLYQNWLLAQKMGMSYQMAKRQPGAAIPLPVMVHWKLGHFSAITKMAGSLYLVEDSTFAQGWISQKVLDAETDGYFLVPNGSLSNGWSSVTPAEGQTIWGTGWPGGCDPNRTGPCDAQSGCSCGPTTPMSQYAVHLMLVSLNINDAPVRYQPPRGPAVKFQVTYNERDPNQPPVFNYSNLGNQWTFNWLSYVQDNPANTNANVTLRVRGGGAEIYTSLGNGQFAVQPESRTQLIQTSTNSYERVYSDGSMDVYTNADSGSPRKVFMTQTVDPAGNAVNFIYDSNFRIVSVVDAIGQVTTVTYGSTNATNSLFYKITQVTDPFGRFATFQYNGSGQLTNLTDVIGITSAFTYGAPSEADFINSLTTPYGTTTFTNNNASFSGRWIQITDPLGGQERVEFTQGAPGVNESDPANLIPTGLDTYGFNDDIAARTSFYWDKKAMLAMQGSIDYTKAKQYVWLRESGNFQTLSGTLESLKQPLENRVWYNYPSQPRGDEEGTLDTPTVIARVLDDGSTQIQQYQYNSIGNPTEAIDSSGRTTLMTYATNNVDLLSINQIAGGATNVLGQFTYNSLHLPLLSVDAAGQTNAFGYNIYGQLTCITNALNQVVALAYDTNGYVTNISGSLPDAPFSQSYDAYGRVRTVTDSQGYAVTYDYDNLDRSTKITYLDGTFQQMVYKNLDRVMTKDRRGHWTRNIYDARRELTAVEDPAGRVTTFDWCTCGSLAGITDPLGQTTTWLRDLQGRVTTKIYQDGTQLNYAYENTTSRLKSMTDAKNQTTSYSYFNDNDLKQVAYNNAVIATPSVSFTYDTNYNRLLTMSDGVGTTAYSYYAVTNGQLGAGKLQSVDGPFANDTITYAYDQLGREVSRAINGAAQQSTYDSYGRMTMVTNVLGSFTNAYLGTTARVSTNFYPNGQKLVLAYFSATNDFRLQQIQNLLPNGQNLSAFNYGYDADGQITNWTEQADAATPTAYTYQYDAADQIVGAALNSTGVGAALLKQFVYSYDSAANRTSEEIGTTTNAPTAISQSSYNSVNQLASRTSSGGPMRFKGSLNETGTVLVAGSPATMKAYTNFTGYANVGLGTNVIQIIASDYSGHSNTNKFQVIVTNNGVAETISFDLNGNETFVVTATSTNAYQWDAANRLLSITGPTNQSLFTYDGFGRRIQIIELQNGMAVSTNKFVWCGTQLCEQRDATGATVTKRFFGQGEQISGVNYYFTRDHLGSVREMTDASGTIQARYDYDPYGRRAKISGGLDADFAFTGDYYHAPSGLYLTLYRAYDSDWGRWLNRDPLTEGAGLNLYTYVGNNPINAVDQLGLFPGGAWWSNVAALAYAIFNLVFHPCEEGHKPPVIPRPIEPPTQRGPVNPTDPIDPPRYIPPEDPWPVTPPIEPEPSPIEPEVPTGITLTPFGLGAAIGFSAVVGVAAGVTVGRSTPYPNGGTINENVTDELVPFWNWWYGYHD